MEDMMIPISVKAAKYEFFYYYLFNELRKFSAPSKTITYGYRNFLKPRGMAN